MRSKTKKEEAEEGTPRRLLQEGRARIESQEAWIKHMAARDSEGRSVSCLSEEACRFCAFGAVYGNLPALTFLERAVHKLYKRHGIVRFNDRVETTHEDVLRVYDLAIDLAKEAEALPLEPLESDCWS